MTAAEVTSYTELIAGIEAGRIEMEVRQLDFEVLIGVTQGHWGKAAGLLQVKKFGIEKIFDALRGAGLRMRLEVDPEQRAKMLARCAENFNPMHANQARMGNHASPVSSQLMGRVFKHFSRLGVKARMRKMSKQQRSAHAKHAATQRWIKHRKRLKAARKASRTRRDRLALMPVQAP